MTFLITFLPKDAETPPDGCYGEIQVGDFRETFLSSLEFWKEPDYERQWREALDRISQGEEKSSLITSIRDPQKTIGVYWWPIYRIGDTLHVQNAIRFFRDLDRPFDLANPYASIPDRRAENEQGQKYSEWITGVHEVIEFLSRDDTS
jgi:hypothetical protein